MLDPVVAAAPDENAWIVACDRLGRPLRVLLAARLHVHPPVVGGVFPLGLPLGGVKVKLQLVAKPKSAAVRSTRPLSACKRDLRDLAWEVARRKPRVTKVAFIILIYFKMGN